MISPSTLWETSHLIGCVFLDSFKKIERSTVTMLDRWNITITNDDSSVELGGQGSQDKDEQEKQQNIPFNIINNYFSIGVVSQLVT